MRIAAILLSTCAALALASATEAHPATTTHRTAGSFDNALIATTALKYVGQWGGEACADAHRSGETASTAVYPTYPDAYSASNPPVGKKINPANGGDGQCRSFVNCILWIASGKTQWVGLDQSDYFEAFTHPSGSGPAGVEITSVADLVEGDIVQEGQTANAPNLHTFIIVKALGGTSFDVVDANYSLDEFVQEHTITIAAFTGDERAFRMGSVVKTPTLSKPQARASSLAGGVCRFIPPALARTLLVTVTKPQDKSDPRSPYEKTCAYSKGQDKLADYMVLDGINVPQLNAAFPSQKINHPNPRAYVIYFSGYGSSKLKSVQAVVGGLGDYAVVTYTHLGNLNLFKAVWAQGSYGYQFSVFSARMTRDLGLAVARKLAKELPR